MDEPSTTNIDAIGIKSEETLLVSDDHSATNAKVENGVGDHVEKTAKISTVEISEPDDDAESSEQSIERTLKSLSTNDSNSCDHVEQKNSAAEVSVAEIPLAVVASEESQVESLEESSTNGNSSHDHVVQKTPPEDFSTAKLTETDSFEESLEKALEKSSTNDGNLHMMNPNTRN